MQRAVPSGTLLQIICQFSGLALSIENSESPHNSRVVGVYSNIQELCQLWYIAPIPGGYEIINAVSDLGFEESAGEIHLTKEKLKGKQLFAMEQTANGAFVIKHTSKTSLVATLESILKAKEFQLNNLSQQFRFKVCTDNLIINMTTMIVSPSTNQALDVPESKREVGLKVILFNRHGRFNQRWILVQVFNNFVIKNFKTGLVLDIRSDTLKNSLVQSKPNKSLNEVWIIEEASGGGYYRIRSLNKPELFLSGEGGKLEVSKSSFDWLLEGARP